jgi:hypothetical protein
LSRVLAVALLTALAAGAARAHEGTLLAQLEAQRAEQEVRAQPAPGTPLIPLRITLRDAATGAPSPGNVRVSDAQAQPFALDLPAVRPRGWYSLAAAAEVLVPAARLRVEAFRGLESGLAVRELDLRGQTGGEVELSLARFVSARERGLLAGNTHLHLMAWPRARVEEYLRSAGAADELDLAFVSYLLRHDSDTPYTSNELGSKELEALSTPSTRFGWGEELRHNLAPYAIGYGHVLLLDLRELVEPVSIGPVLAGTAVDAPGLAGGIDAAHAQGAAAIWAHGDSGSEDLPSWLLGRLDAQNLFDGAEPNAKPRGDHASYARVFYRLLDVGLRVPFSTGTDWFLTDLSRVYVPLAGEATPAAWLAQLRAGRSFITNGPLLELEVAGAAPGGVVAREGPGALPVRARAIGRVNFGALEVVASGRVVARAEAVPAGDHYEAQLASEVAIDEPSWLAARVAPGDAESELGQPLFAHTSAITVELAGAAPFRSNVARALVLEMDWNARAIRAERKLADAAQADAVTAPYREAIDALSPRLAWRDRLHAWLVRTLRTLRDWLFG